MAKKVTIKQKTNISGDLTTIYPVTSADMVEETSDRKFLTSSERTKLSKIENGANVNKVDTIKIYTNNSSTAQTFTYDSNKRITLPQLVRLSNGKIPENYLPDGLNDVISGTLSSGVFKDLNGSTIAGKTGQIYIDTTLNKTYRYSTTAGFVEISPSLAVGVDVYDGAQGAQDSAKIGTTSDNTDSTLYGYLNKVSKVASSNSINNTSFSTDYSSIINGKTDVGKASTVNSFNSNLTFIFKDQTDSNHQLASISFKSGTVSVNTSMPTKNTNTSIYYDNATVDQYGRAVTMSLYSELLFGKSTTDKSNLAVNGLFFEEV